ncbi:unnamed protein product [Caenorhabditis brenneri]
MAAHPKSIGEQMAAFNNSDDTSFVADQSTGLLNATCPGRIQNTTEFKNRSLLNETTASSSGGKWQRPKREALKITPLAQIDEVSPPQRDNARERNSDYKTRICIAFRRDGHCPYNNKCTYAHGSNELRMPRRRPSVDYNRERRDSHENREDRDHRENREPRERRDSRSRRNEDSSFSRGGSSSRYRDDNRRYGQSSSSRSSYRQICHAFERGECPYGPRCRYRHVEQMPQFNGNATMYVPSSDGPPMAFYHQQAQTYVSVYPYFVAPPHHAPNGPPPPPQFMAPCDLNQSMSFYPPQGNYYYTPMAPTPVMDQSAVVVAGPETFPEGFFAQPPPQLTL